MGRGALTVGDRRGSDSDIRRAPGSHRGLAAEPSLALPSLSPTHHAASALHLLPTSGGSGGGGGGKETGVVRSSGQGSWYIDSRQFITADTVVVTLDLYARSVSFAKYTRPGLSRAPSGHAAPARRASEAAPGEDAAAAALAGGVAVADEGFPVPFSGEPWLRVELGAAPISAASAFFLAVSILSNGNNSGNNQVKCTLLVDDADAEE